MADSNPAPIADGTYWEFEDAQHDTFPEHFMFYWQLQAGAGSGVAFTIWGSNIETLAVPPPANAPAQAEDITNNILGVAVVNAPAGGGNVDVLINDAAGLMKGFCRIWFRFVLAGGGNDAGYLMHRFSRYRTGR